MKIKLIIAQRKKVAEKTHEISFDLTGKKFSFKAGQYIRVTLPKLLFDDVRGLSRVFTIASSPNEKDKLKITFRNSGSGFKKTLLTLPLKSTITIEGPFGEFTLPENNSRPLVFIAGGIGITPFISMIRFVNENKLSIPITLLYANRDREHAAFLKELSDIASTNNNFLLVNKFGRLTGGFIKQHIKNLDTPSWYIVGPPLMVDSTKKILSDLGVNGKKINLESFSGY